MKDIGVTIIVCVGHKPDYAPRFGPGRLPPEF